MADGRRFEALVDGLPDVVLWEADAASLRPIFVSRGAEALLGYPVARWLAEPDFWLEHVHPADRERTGRVRRQAVAAGQDHELEYRMLDVRGRAIWLRDRAYVVRDAAGRIGWIRGVIQDITEPKVRQARRAAQHAVTRVLADAPTLGEAAPSILRAICESLGWELGALWLLDGDARELRCLELWHVPGLQAPGFAAISRQRTFSPGVGLPGRVWATGEAAWIPDVVEDPNFPRAPVAAREGLHGAFGFPIRVRTDVVGVIEFFSREIREPDEHLFQMMDSVGSQIGQFLERKGAEEARRAGEERLRVALEAGRMGAWDWNVRTGEVRWSDSLAELHGIAPGSFGGTVEAYLADVHPDDRERVVQALGRALETRADHDIAYRIVRPDGAVRWVEGKGRVLTDVAGQPVRMTGVCMDITERKREEEERARLLAREQAARAETEAARERSAFLAEATAVLAASLDYATTLATLARLAVPHLGDWCAVDVLEEDGSIDRMAVIHADPAKAELARELQRRYPLDPRRSHPIVRALHSGEPQVMPDIEDREVRAIARDPDHLRLLRGLGFRSIMTVPLVARGRTLGAISFASGTPGRFGPGDLALARDLARRAALAVDNARLYREAEAANRAKDEFLATLSHELRTPLTAILGWTQLLRSAQLDEATRARALETLERNARLQAQLINDLLDISRIVSGKLVLDARPIDVQGVVDAALDTVRPAAQAKGVRLEAALDPWTGPVLADPDRLQQVVWNLLVNAIKFTPRDGRVEVRVERKGSRVQVTVADTGEGIRAEVLPYIFDRFRQADSRTTRTHGGLGLGLAIVRHVVELHGGSVHAESAGEGRGAVFTVTLPLAAAVHTGEEPGGGTTGVGAPRLPALGGLHVLVVEDEPDTRALLAAILTQSGAEVTAVGSAAEALAMLGRIRPDVLLSDIALPGDDGYALLEKVRALPPERGGEVPAVAVTAYAGSADRQRSLEAGFQKHVPKPVNAHDLLEAIAGVVRRAGAA